MAKKRKLHIPVELKLPFPLAKIAELCLEEPARSDLFSPGSPFHFETKRRLLMMADYLEEPWPTSERDWLRFVYAICETFHVPGFISLRKGGAPRKWNEKKYLRLFEEVAQLRRTNTSLSEHGACVFIAKNSQRYLNLFPENAKTLHRHFIRAKNKFGKLPLNPRSKCGKTIRKGSQ
jgi:hypothetical protein